MDHVEFTAHSGQVSEKVAFSPFVSSHFVDYPRTKVSTNVRSVICDCRPYI